MAKEVKAETKAQAVKSGRIKSKVDYDVTINEGDCIVAPRQELKIEDFSKLSSFSPKEILVFAD